MPVVVVKNEFDHRDRTKFLAHLRTFGAWNVQSKERNIHISIHLVFTSSKISNEKRLEQVKPEDIEKYPFGHGNVWELFEYFAFFGLRRYSGSEQF